MLRVKCNRAEAHRKIEAATELFRDSGHHVSVFASGLWVQNDDEYWLNRGRHKVSMRGKNTFVVAVEGREKLLTPTRESIIFIEVI